MIEILRQYYPYQFSFETSHSGFTAFEEHDGWVIVLPADYLDENTITEQYVIAKFIQEAGFKHVAVPVYTNDGNFIVPLNEDSTVYVCHVYPLSAKKDYTQTTTFLQSFHQAGLGFPFSPVYVNRYGKWKENWEQIIDQIDFLRQQYLDKEQLTEWERIWLESSFYFIGIGENAIQYLEESLQERQFNNFDQPVFTFERIATVLNNGIVEPKSIVHDHPTRDLAELFRQIILKNGREGISIITDVLVQYHEKRPLSLFGLKLLFGRLMFPIHFLDYTSEMLSKDSMSEMEYKRLKIFISYQTEYEYCLKQIHQVISEKLQMDLPSVEWLYSYQQ